MKDAKSLSELYPKRYDIPALIVLCAVALYISLCLPLFKVEKMIFWKTEYSVMTGVVGLLTDKQYFLAAILFFFSIVFPTVKLFILGWLWLVRLDVSMRKRVFAWLEVLGKWSMLDVFVVAILIVAVKLGPLANVTPRAGVYVFAGTILATLLTTVWIERLNR